MAARCVSPWTLTTSCRTVGWCTTSTKTTCHPRCVSVTHTSRSFCLLGAAYPRCFGRLASLTRCCPLCLRPVACQVHDDFNFPPAAPVHMGDILRNSLPSPPLPLRPCDIDRPQGLEAVLRRVNTTTVEPEESEDPLSLYKPHDCGGDKCTFPGCRFTMQLRFSVEKAAIVLSGGTRILFKPPAVTNVERVLDSLRCRHRSTVVACAFPWSGYRGSY